MIKATFFFRDGELIITQVEDAHDSKNIAQRMVSGGFIVGSDSFWGKSRKVVINLLDVKYVVLESGESNEQAAK